MKKFLSILSIIGITFTAVPDIAFADDALKLGDTFDIPVIYLNHGIDETQTTNITAAPAIRNNAEINIPSMSGVIMEVSRSGLTETVFATRLTVNASTNVITLTGTVIRDVCFNQARALITCSHGLKWSKGAEMRLVDSAKRLNRFVDSTRSSVFSASGAVAFRGSGSLAIPTFATTTDRDRNMGATPVGPVRTACVVSTNLCYYYIGGSWISYGSGGTINATISARGVSELSTTTDILNGTLTGDSGAPLVLSTGLVTRTSTGSTQANKILALGSNGACSVTVGCTGTGKGWAGTGILMTNGLSNFTSIKGTASGDILKWNDGSKEWNATTSTSTADIDVLTGSITAAQKFIDPQANVAFNQTGALLPSQINTAGKRFQVVAGFSNVGWGAGNLIISLALGGTPVGECVVTPTNLQGFIVVFYGTVRKVNAGSGTIVVNTIGSMDNDQNCSAFTNTSGINTAVTETVNILARFNNTNAANTVQLQQFWIDSHTP